MVPAATGTDTAGSLRIPSALSGTSTIKPTRGLVSLRGVVPLSPGLDHGGPMARTVADCVLLLAGMTGTAPDRLEPRALEGVRLAISPRIGDLEPDVAAGFDAAVDACRRLGAEIVEPFPAEPPLAVIDDWGTVLLGDTLPFHRRFDDRRELYRPSLREWVERAEEAAVTLEAYAAAEVKRAETTALWTSRFVAERVTALLEPTEPVVAPVRGSGYDHAGTDIDLIALTHYWNWTGFPVVALPSGVGAATGLPVSVSLIGPAGSDWELLALGIALQEELGVPRAPGY
jgi:Asp-tRNA(Asn)/Glu-tRNA(Gln) amidotransferase A subunit family amidase